MRHRGFSLVELLVSIAMVGLLASLLLPTLARSFESSHRAACQNNLKQLATAFRIYAKENKDLYPRMHGDQPFGPQEAAVGCERASYSDECAFSPDMRALYPEYTVDPTVLLCPSAGPRADRNPLGIVRDDGSGRCGYTGLVTRGDTSYYYLGYVLDRVDGADPVLPGRSMGPGQLVGLMAFLAPALSNRDPLDDAILDRDADLAAVGFGGLGFGNDGHDTVERLSLGADHLISAIASTLPVMWDRVRREAGGGVVYNHQPDGCNVLYLDGHVAFTTFANEFPSSPGFANLATLF